jgi:hypothetical protein
MGVKYEKEKETKEEQNIRHSFKEQKSGNMGRQGNITSSFFYLVGETYEKDRMGKIAETT